MWCGVVWCGLVERGAGVWDFQHSIVITRGQEERIGGESDREIRMGPACVVLSLRVWSSINAPGLGLPLGFLFEFVAK